MVAVVLFCIGAMQLPIPACCIDQHASPAGHDTSHCRPSLTQLPPLVPRPNGEIVSTLGTETLPGTIGADLMAMLERKLLCDVVLVVVDR